MDDFTPRKIVSVADAFLTAVGVITPENDTGRKIHAEMNEREAGRVDFYISSTFSAAMNDSNPAQSREKMEKNTLALSELFSSVSIRASIEKDAAACIKVAQTDENTATDLEAAGAPSFAKLVRIARSGQ